MGNSIKSQDSILNLNLLSKKMKHIFYYLVLIITIISCKDNGNNTLPTQLKSELTAQNNVNKTEKNIDITQDPILTFEHNGKSKIGQINDPDGYSNLRSDKSSKSNVIAKILTDQYFFYLPNKTENWYKVKDLQGNIGFIHKSRISEVLDKKLYNLSFTNQTTREDYRKDTIVAYANIEKAFENLWEVEFNYKPLQSNSNTENSITFEERGIEVTITQEKTRPDLTVSYEENWGVENGNPKYQYKSIDIVDNGKAYSIPKSEFSDLYDPTLYPDHNEVFTDINNQTILKVSNSDGAGSYVAIFIIEQQKVVKRIVYHPF